MKTISILTSLLISSTALAGFSDGHDRGNGGDALVCKNAQGQVTAAHFFDLYEAQEKFGMALVPPRGTTLEEKVLNLIDRVASVDPIRAKVMKLWYKTFNKESSMKPGITLVDVPDTGDAFWPKECDLAQLVVQTELELPLNPYRYLFSKDIWQLLDDNNKAATIVHELLWREARIAKHKTSAAIRYFNGLFLSDGFKNLSYDEYQELIEKLNLLIHTSKEGYPIGDYKTYEGIEFTVGPAHFKMQKTKYQDDRFVVSEGYANSGNLEDHLASMTTPSLIEQKNIREVKAGGNKIYLTGEFVLNRLQFNSLVYGGKDGSWTLSNKPLTWCSDNTYNCKVGLYALVSNNEEIRYSMFAQNTEGVSDITTFDIGSDGKSVKSVTSKIDQNFVYDGYARTVALTCKATAPIEFYKSEFEYNFKSCILKFKTVLETENGKKVLVPAGKRVYVNYAFALLKVQ